MAISDLSCSSIGSVFCHSVAQSCPTLCDPMACSTPGFPVLHHLPELAETHPIKSVMPSNHLILCLPLLLLPSVFPSIKIFSSKLALHIRWSKHWSFSFSISPPMNIQGWFPCSPRDSQESSPAPQFENINSLALSLLCGPTLTSIRVYWKNQSFDCNLF